MTFPTDLVDEYRAYLGRFEKLAGEVAFGTPVKWKGCLLAKLSYEQFEARFGDYARLLTNYEEVLARSDTIKDSLLKLLRDLSAELLLDREF